MTLTYEFDPDKVNVNHHVQYLCQTSLLSKVNVRTCKHTDIPTEPTDCFTRPLKQSVTKLSSRLRSGYTGQQYTTSAGRVVSCVEALQKEQLAHQGINAMAAAEAGVV